MTNTIKHEMFLGLLLNYVIKCTYSVNIYLTVLIYIFCNIYNTYVSDNVIGTTMVFSCLLDHLFKMRLDQE